MNIAISRCGASSNNEISRSNLFVFDCNGVWVKEVGIVLKISNASFFDGLGI